MNSYKLLTRSLGLPGGLVFLLGFVLLAGAQNYSIDWSTIGGGGGTSTGSGYSVSGTIGQPDAGAMTGGDFTLAGGFWGIVAAVQTPGAPVLRVFRSATNTVVVAWPDPSAGFTLQENPDLIVTHWVDAIPLPTVVGGEQQVIAAPPAGNRFYRLKKP